MARTISEELVGGVVAYIKHKNTFYGPYSSIGSAKAQASALHERWMNSTFRIGKPVIIVYKLQHVSTKKWPKDES